MGCSRRAFLTLAGLGLLTRPALSHAQTPAQYAVEGDLFSGSGPVQPGRAVLVHRGLIEDVVPAGTVTDRPVLNQGKAHILPGLINGHCHAVHTPQDRRERWLRAGVTSIGDVGAPIPAIAQLRRSPAGGTATASLTGPMLAPPGGYPLPIHSPDHALAVESPAAGRDAVRRLADLGATQIKLAFEPGVLPEPWPRFDPATAAAICDAARALGLMVRCHVEDLSGLEPALNAGVAGVEHVPHRWRDNGTIRMVLTDDGEPVPEYLALLERMARDRVVLTPTLDVFTRTPWNGPALFEPVRAFHAMGGRVAVGNDFPYRRTDAGLPLKELELLGRAGLDNEAVLEAATRTGAEVCGLANRGTIAKGMAADLLLVADDPTRDFDTLKHPLLIIKDGAIIS